MIEVPASGRHHFNPTDGGIMRRSFLLATLFVACAIIPAGGFAQRDRLAGRWEGKVQAPQGERQAVLNIRKEGDKYVGSVSGLRGDSEAEVQDLKIEGDRVTAKTEIQGPQGAIVINYDFTLAGETMKGTGSIDFGGQAFSFDFDLKRVGEASSAAPAGPTRTGEGRQEGQQRRPSVPQPQQAQKLEYFTGEWHFTWVGRESALGPGPMQGTLTYTPSADGKSLNGVAVGKSDEGSVRHTSVMSFDETSKVLSYSESHGSGVSFSTRGDWSSPIAVKFEVATVTAQGHTLKLKRVISIVSAHSFTVTDELSEDGGPFVRLGNGVFSKAGK